MERGWGVRLFNPSGTLHSEGVAKVKSKIGPVCRGLLRWYDKCTFRYSRYADKARHRAWSKDMPKDMICNQKHISNGKH